MSKTIRNLVFPLKEFDNITSYLTIQGPLADRLYAAGS